MAGSGLGYVDLVVADGRRWAKRCSALPSSRAICAGRQYAPGRRRERSAEAASSCLPIAEGRMTRDARGVRARQELGVPLGCQAQSKRRQRPEGLRIRPRRLARRWVVLDGHSCGPAAGGGALASRSTRGEDCISRIRPAVGHTSGPRSAHADDDGPDPSPRGDPSCDNVRVPAADACLGEHGCRVARRSPAPSAISPPSRSLRSRSVEPSAVSTWPSRYAKSRVQQFGRPIGSFQAIQAQVRRHVGAPWNPRAPPLYYAACIADEDGATISRRTRPRSRRPGARRPTSECAADNIQIHGGVGFTWEYDVQLHLKRAKSTESFLGDPAWHRERVARLIGL